MAAASSVVTFLVQRAGGAVRSLESFPPVGAPAMRSWPMPVISGCSSGRPIWPSSILTPAARFPVGESCRPRSCSSQSAPQPLALRRKAPFLFVGWFWFFVDARSGDRPGSGRYFRPWRTVTRMSPRRPFRRGRLGGPRDLSGRRYGSLALRAAAGAAVLALARTPQRRRVSGKTARRSFSMRSGSRRTMRRSTTTSATTTTTPGRPPDAVPHLTEADRIRSRRTRSTTPTSGGPSFCLGRPDEAAEQFSQALILQPGADRVEQPRSDTVRPGRDPGSRPALRDRVAKRPNGTEARSDSQSRS